MTEVDSEVALALLEKVFQPPVFFLVVFHLDFDDAVALHDAFPTMRHLWETSGNYVRWFHRHVKWGDLLSSHRMSGVTNDFERITFDAYVQHVHWHLHGKLGAAASSPRYKSNVLHYMGMAPLDRHFAVADCVFLPKSSPGVFSGNLALLGTEGELALFHAGSCEYVLTACLQLDFSADSLFSSPGGTLLVISSERGCTTVVDLSAPEPKAMVTRVTIPRDNFHRACFSGERSFLYWGESPDPEDWNLFRCDVTASGVELNLVADHSTLGQIFQHDQRARLSYLPVLMYRPPEDGERGFALFWERQVGGFSNRLRVMGETPAGSLVRGSSDHYHTFDSCRVCSACFSPDRDSMFVLVIFEEPANVFFANETAERSRTEPALDSSCLSSTCSRFGRCAFYVMTFDDEGATCATPRFFSGSWPSPEPDLFPLHWERELNFNCWSDVAAVCTSTHLTLKYKEGVVCHFSRIGGRLAQPYYDAVVATRLFAISEDHRHHAYFLGDEPYWKEMLSGYRECQKYDKSFRTRPKPFPLKLPHLNIELTYL